jgi:hypothetical protein
MFWRLCGICPLSTTFRELSTFIFGSTEERREITALGPVKEMFQNDADEGSRF